MVFPTTDVYVSPIALRKTLSIFPMSVPSSLSTVKTGGESNALMENFVEEEERVD